MGSLYYGDTTEPFEIPDRLLAHVKVVAATKLRRGESFTLTWPHSPGSAIGTTTVWMQPAIPLRFVFAGAEAEKLDPMMLKRLAAGANGSRGLVLDLADWEERPLLALATASA